LLRADSLGPLWRRSRTRVNAVCPGVIDTPMSAAMGEYQADAMKEIMRDQPIGRKGRPTRSPRRLSGCAAPPRVSCSAWLCQSTAASLHTDAPPAPIAENGELTSLSLIQVDGNRYRPVLLAAGGGLDTSPFAIGRHGHIGGALGTELARQGWPEESRSSRRLPHRLLAHRQSHVGLSVLSFWPHGRRVWARVPCWWLRSSQGLT
jgi:hypothetical protein